MSRHPRPRETKLAAKRGRILHEIFRNTRSYRFDLARQLNINATMVSTYVDEFLREGILVEREPMQTRGGRVVVPLRLNPDYGCFLGIDFEALRARAVLTDLSGDLIVQEEVSFGPRPKREDVVGTILSLARRVADRATSPLRSVGVAAPGQVDCIAGRVLHYRLLPDFDQVPIRERFEEVFDVPVFVEDNIRAVAYAELLRGSGRNSRNFLCLAVRSGVGLGVVIDGKLYGGASAMAGEAGYMVFPTPDGPRFVTDLVSATGFLALIRDLLRSWQRTAAREELLAKGEDLTLAHVIQAAEDGDALLWERLRELGRNLGIVAATLANLFAPEKIILAGEVPKCSLLVRETMERTFREFTLPHILGVTYLEDGTLGGFAGALGAAWLGFQKVFPHDEEVVRDRAEAKRKAV